MPSWLKYIGKAAVAVGTNLPIYGPIVKSFIPQAVQVIDRATEVTDKFDEIGNIIIATEVLSAGLTTPIPGPEKLKAATAPVAIILQNFLKIKGLELDKNQQALFMEGVQDITSGFAKVYNSCKEP
jgi:hypothetical protein